MHFLSSLVVERDCNVVADITRSEEESGSGTFAAEIPSMSLSEERKVETVNRKMKGYLSKKYQALPEETLDMIEEPVYHTDSSVVGSSRSIANSSIFAEAIRETVGTPKTEPPLEKRRFMIKGEQYLKRDQDDIIIIPGAKHSFEAVGGELVEIVAGGLIDWLSERVVGNEAIDSK